MDQKKERLSPRMVGYIADQTLSIVPRSERGSGVVSIEDCVNGGRQNLALYALRSKEVIITATAELKL